MNNKIKLSTEDKIINVFAATVAAFLFILCVYPIYYCFIASISDGQAAAGQQVYLWPIKPTLENYKMVFQEDSLFQAYFMTILRTVVGTLTGTIFTGLIAYPLSRSDLKGRKVYTIIFIITMYFGGGIIPQYLVYRAYGIVNTFSVYILPSLLNVFNLMLCMNFFNDIPNEIIEAAKIDGAGEYRIFLKIMLPLSKPIIATIALFTGVYHWNDWFMTTYFTTSTKLNTLPSVLMQLVSSADAQAKINKMMMTGSGVSMGMANQGPTADSIRYATMLISIIPIMLIYPFIQKYFDKGIMLGGVKA